MTAPILPYQLNRARKHGFLPASKTGTKPPTPSIRVVPGTGGPAVFAGTPVLAQIGRAVQQAARPESAGSVRAFPGRMGTGPHVQDIRRPAMATTGGHTASRSQVGAAPRTTSRRRSGPSGVFAAGNTSTLPTYLHVRIIRTARKDPHEMANSRHPLEVQVKQMHTTLNKFLKIALRDGTLDPEEREVQECIRHHKDEIAAFNLRRQANASYERNGDSRHTRDLYKMAGTGLVDLNRERATRRSNVIAFPSDRNRAS